MTIVSSKRVGVGRKLSALFLLASLTMPAFAERDFGMLEFSATVADERLKMVTSVEISKDGKFLYASAWQAATVSVFRRDLETGQLTLLQSITDAETLNGSTALRLSPDGKHAVATAFTSKTAVLFSRDQESGELTQLDVAKQDVDDVTGLRWAIDCDFSPDSKFVYVVDARSVDEAGVLAGSLTVFRITEAGKLEFVEASRDSLFANARGVSVSADGGQIAVTCSDSAAVVLLERKSDTGRTTLRQIVQDEKEGVTGLDGAMAMARSPDGQFLYVSAGRFRGDDAVGVYQLNNERKLMLVEEHLNAESDLEGFRGGNEITVSPDGKNVYAVASRSHALACFSRDVNSGQLKFLETIENDQERLKGAAGICVSPDGSYVYVAAEQSNAITIYRRQTAK